MIVENKAYSKAVNMLNKVKIPLFDNSFFRIIIETSFKKV